MKKSGKCVKMYQNFIQFSLFSMQNSANIFTYFWNSDFSEQYVVFSLEIWLEKHLEKRIGKQHFKFYASLFYWPTMYTSLLCRSLKYLLKVPYIIQDYPDLPGFLIFETLCLGRSITLSYVWKISQKWTAFVFGRTQFHQTFTEYVSS